VCCRASAWCLLAPSRGGVPLLGETRSAELTLGDLVGDPCLLYGPFPANAHPPLGVRAFLPVARCRSSGPLGALLSSPALDVRLMTALQVLQVRFRKFPGKPEGGVWSSMLFLSRIVLCDRLLL